MKTLMRRKDGLIAPRQSFCVSWLKEFITNRCFDVKYFVAVIIRSVKPHVRGVIKVGGGTIIPTVAALERLRPYSFTRVVFSAVLIVALVPLSACRPIGSKQSTALTSGDDLVQRYLALAVELGERDPDSLDFYVGSDSSVEASRSHAEKLETMRSSVRVLSREVSDLPESSSFDADRKSLLLHQLDALCLRSEQLLGSNRSFNEESAVLFGVTYPVDSDSVKRKKIRSRLDLLLGRPANLSRAYARYDGRFVVPDGLVPAVLNAAIGECRRVTAQYILLPPGEHVDVEYVTHKPWSAFSRYLGRSHSLIQVNMDYPITVDRLLDLACHEGYPGHHVFNSVREQMVVGRLHHDEFLAQPTFSPQSYVSEAAASYAPELALSDSERLHIERDVLFRLAGLKRNDCKRYIEVQRLISALHTAEPSIAQEYLDGRLEFVRAAEELERETLMEHGEVLLLYLNEYRSYMLTYTMGRDSVRELIESGHPTEEQRWQRYYSLMINPVVSLPSAQD